MLAVPIRTDEHLSCRAFPWRFGGAPYLGVVVKAAFALEHEARFHPIGPARIWHGERYERGNPARGIVAPDDTDPYVPQAEVAVVGSAYEYGVSPRELRLLVQRDRDLIDKRLHVITATPDPVELSWTLAAQGPLNPLGCANPMIVDAHRPDVPSTFLPISKHVPTRARRHMQPNGHAPKRVDGWMDVPRPFDWRYYCSVPADQQLDRLVGDEVITMIGMHPTHQTLVTQLSDRHAFVFVAYRADLAWTPLPMMADRLLLYPDRMRATLTWRGSIAFHDVEAMSAVRLYASLATDSRALQLVPPHEVTEAPPLLDEQELDLTGTFSLDARAQREAADRSVEANRFPKDSRVEPHPDLLSNRALPFLPANVPAQREPWATEKGLSDEPPPSSIRAPEPLEHQAVCTQPPHQPAPVPPVPDEASSEQVILTADCTSPTEAPSAPLTTPLRKGPPRPSVPDVAAELYGLFN